MQDRIVSARNMAYILGSGIARISGRELQED
jgi:hypothetical protein